MSTDRNIQPPMPPEDAAPKGGYEKKDANVRRIVITMVASVVILTLVIVGLNQLFVATKEEVRYENVLSQGNPRLQELHARETRELTTYAWVDSSRGIVRIPIERAMKLMVDEAYRKQMKQAKRSGR